MNYLAHLLLSGNDEQIMVGNFIGDHIKGGQWEKFPEKIQKGIQIHRQIDNFTDKHPKFREAKAPFRAEFGLYSGIVVDFLYDHFLASNFQHYSDISLPLFSNKAHAALMNNFIYLPERVQGFLPFLIKNRRLESYATHAGIIDAMKTMSNYSSLPSKSGLVSKILTDSYIFFEENFRIFMFEIIAFINEKHGFDFKNPSLPNQNFS